MDYIKLIAIVLVSAIVGGSVSAMLTPKSSVDLVSAGIEVAGDFLGATTARTTITNPWTFTQAITQGSTGTAVSRVNSGFCNIQANATTITASTTKTVDCQASTNGTQSALTGVTANDLCIVKNATTSPTTSNGLAVVGSSASSTAGYITMNVSNLTGTTFTWTAGASTSWPYICYDLAETPFN